MAIKEVEEAKAIKQFARFAHRYNDYNRIQAEVAKRLVREFSHEQYKHIVDIGCGSGEVYKNIKKNKIKFDSFVALDSSSEMLGFHPEDSFIKKFYADFNKIETFNALNTLEEETLLVSSSALQWSKNLDFLFEQLAKKSAKAYFSIFTANTFKSLHQLAGIPSPIYSANILKEVIQKYYNANFKLEEYRLEFETTMDMFRYIKNSGVSGGEKKLNYQQTKKLMNDYPLRYLEFEVLFVEANPLRPRKVRRV